MNFPSGQRKRNGWISLLYGFDLRMVQLETPQLEELMTKGETSRFIF
jgi:hypothetical protein